ncbi:MAG: flagellar motor protein MotB [Cycloclasticus sp.]
MSIERRSNSDVADETPREDEHDTWAISYIDLLLLMVTLFILLLSYQQQTIKQTAVEQEKYQLASAKNSPLIAPS